MEQLQDKLVSSFILFENSLGEAADSPVHQLRQEGMRIFEQKGFPTKKDEEWKYTNLRPVAKHDYRIFPQTEVHLEYKDVKRYFLNDIDTYKVVFVDGVYSSWLSQTTHQGADVCTFSNALRKYRNVVDEYLGKAAPLETSTVALNTAFAKEGAYIRIPKNTALDKPVEILYFSTNSDKELMVQVRNLVVLEEGAQAQIIERHQSLGDSQVLTNAVSEVFCGANAKVSWYKIQNDRSTAALIDHTTVLQDRDSRAEFGTYTLGGRFVRNNLHFHLNGSGSHAELKGISLLGENEFADHHTLVDHKVAHCTSNETYKGIYDGNAHGVFNGKVMVHPHAQKTNAFQQNDNLLLSDKASVDTKPQLEIFADDVKCSHGCTVGQLDEEALFYLRSRGIAEREAQALLMYAFASDALEGLDIQELKQKLNLIIAKKLNVDLDFDI